MKIDVSERPLSDLEGYADISIAFEVNRVLDIAASTDKLGEFVLAERSLDVPYIKDYDAISGANPSQWSTYFDVANWGVFAASVAGQRVGGAVVAFDTPGLTMSEGSARDGGDAVLWDIRVSPEARGQGAGAALFRAAAEWARARGCRQLRIETQNTNVPACRFYARQGCVVEAVHPFAYPELPHEIQLLWRKDLFDEKSDPEARTRRRG